MLHEMRMVVDPAAGVGDVGGFVCYCPCGWVSRFYGSDYGAAAAEFRKHLREATMTEGERRRLEAQRRWAFEDRIAEREEELRGRAAEPAPSNGAEEPTRPPAEGRGP